MKYKKQSKKAIYNANFSYMLELVKYTFDEFIKFDFTNVETQKKYDVIFVTHEDLVLVHAVCEFFIHYFPKTREVLESLNFEKLNYAKMNSLNNSLYLANYKEIIHFIIPRLGDIFYIPE